MTMNRLGFGIPHDRGGDPRKAFGFDHFGPKFWKALSLTLGDFGQKNIADLSKLQSR